MPSLHPRRSGNRALAQVSPAMTRGPRHREAGRASHRRRAFFAAARRERKAGRKMQGGGVCARRAPRHVRPPASRCRTEKAGKVDALRPLGSEHHSHRQRQMKRREDKWLTFGPSGGVQAPPKSCSRCGRDPRADAPATRGQGSCRRVGRGVRSTLVDEAQGGPGHGHPRRLPADRATHQRASRSPLFRPLLPAATQQANFPVGARAAHH